MRNSLEQKIGNSSFYKKFKSSLAGKMGAGLLTITFGFGSLFYGCSNDGSSKKPNPTPNPTQVYECIDNDGDGYGKYCEKGDDCDDDDSNKWNYKIFYRDFDGDGYGHQDSLIELCSSSSSPPSGYATNNLDFNDNNASINPDAVEICDSIDNNCNGQIDEGVKNTYYLDYDGDGYGNPSNSTQACSLPPGYVTNNLDCDDNNNLIHPTAIEICDSIDNNCNGQIDEGVKNTYYLDYDGDGYGNSNNTIQACSLPSGYVTNNLDCND